jgi:hypothetical protein
MTKYQVSVPGDDIFSVEAKTMQIKDDHLYFYDDNGLKPLAIFKEWTHVWDIDQLQSKDPSK